MLLLSDFFAGVYLSLKGVVCANNSLVTMNEIGRKDDSIKCITDKKPCCTSPFRVGQWLFPDRNVVPIAAAPATSFYRYRSDVGGIYLNRLNSDITDPTGQFCCMVPDATDEIQTLCINISKFLCKQ